MAKRGGSGVVVVMVIAVVLALVGITVSVIFIMEYNHAREALIASQDEFGILVGGVFRDNQWTLSKLTDPESDVSYGKAALNEVKVKLHEAATFEKMRPKLGEWNNAADLADAIRNSALQRDQEGTEYGSIFALLDAHEFTYGRQKEEVARLETERDTLNAQRVALKKKLDDETTRLGAEVVAAQRKQKDAAAEAAQRYADIQKMYKSALKDKVEWQGKLDEARREWEIEQKKLSGQIAYWQTAYEKEIAVELAADEMKPAGRIVDIDRAYEFIMLEGGADMGRKAQTTYVVYSVAPSGAETVKGRIKIMRVLNFSSRAGITEKVEPMIKGDLFVAQPVWDSFHKPKEEVVARVGPTVPGVTAAEPEEEEKETETVDIGETEEEESEEETKEDTGDDEDWGELWE